MHLNKVITEHFVRNFTKVMDRAMLACQNSGFDVADYFAEVSKMIKLAKSAERQVIDYELSGLGIGLASVMSCCQKIRRHGGVYRHRRRVSQRG